MTDNTAPLAPNEYRCALCHQVYTKAWSDEEALAETAQYWPDVPQEELAVVCDECWQKIDPARHPVEYAASLEGVADRSEQRIAHWKQEGLSTDEMMQRLIREMLDTLSKGSGYYFTVKHESKYDRLEHFLPLKKDELL